MPLTLPSSRTTILSASTTVESRWAMTTTVCSSETRESVPRQVALQARETGVGGEERDERQHGPHTVRPAVIAPSTELTASGCASAASVPKIPITQTNTSVARCGLANANSSLKVAFGTPLGVLAHPLAYLLSDAGASCRIPDKTSSPRYAKASRTVSGLRR